MSERINQDCSELNRLLAYDWAHLGNLDKQHVKQTMAALDKLRRDAAAEPGGAKEALAREYQFIKKGTNEALQKAGLLPDVSFSMTPVPPVGPGQQPGDREPYAPPTPEPKPCPTRTPDEPQWPKTPAYEDGDRVTISDDAWRATKITAGLWLTYEVLKWGAAIAAAPETGCASLGAAAAAP